MNPHFRGMKKHKASKAFSRSLAHFVVGTESCKKKRAFPSLGLRIVQKNKQYVVKSLGMNSLMKKSGWRKGDIILMLNGKSFPSLTKLQLYITYLEQNSILKWVIRRANKEKRGETKLCP